MSYLPDEAQDEMGQAIDLDQHMKETLEAIEATEIAMDLERQEREAEEMRANCDHDYDRGAGGGQVMHSGAFEILNVCVKCGDVQHTGKYDSIL
jgi:hypothetical protein